MKSSFLPYVFTGTDRGLTQFKFYGTIVENERLPCD